MNDDGGADDGFLGRLVDDAAADGAGLAGLRRGVVQAGTRNDRLDTGKEPDRESE